jgi:hypothetical protein
MASERKIINITSTNAGQGIKERYDTEAMVRGRTSRPFISSVIAYACANKIKFKGKLENMAEKGGTHISIEVPADIKDELKAWADEQGSTQALLANHVLEKALELNVLEKIFD